jgi:tRNA (guanine37-N1)-methyltransferase
MVLRVDVMEKAVKKAKEIAPKAKVLLMTPQGRILKQDVAREMADSNQDLILICGHYEGFDERIRQLVDEEISIGPFVLTGGEIPAMAVIDSVARLIPGVLGKEESAVFETFSTEGEIEYPQYTRPEEWRGEKVPEVLLSGHHLKIEEWRKKQSELRSEKHKNM